MTPKEKAKELVNKYMIFTSRLQNSSFIKYDAKQCAIIAVGEIIKAYPCIDYIDRIEIEYWFDVKQEIERL